MLLEGCHKCWRHGVVRWVGDSSAGNWPGLTFVLNCDISGPCVVFEVF